MNKKTKGLIGLLVTYFVLVFIDIGANAAGVTIPGVGALAETVSESVIEVISGIIVLIIASMKGE